jgi:cell division protein FtsI (penicillin-binding protein 3)
VPHDQPLKTKKEMLAATPKDVLEDGPSDNGADLDAMFADVNNLPADDPLRRSANAGDAAGVVDAVKEVAASAPAPVPAVTKKTTAKSATVMDLLPAKAVAAFRAKVGLDAQGNTASETAAVEMKPFAPRGSSTGEVTVDAGKKVAVPVFDGASLRTVVERAGSAGLRVQPVGTGLAHDQRPAAGTMVPEGTEVVVRFSR